MKKLSITDCARTRNGLLGATRIEAFDDCKGISLTFSGRDLSICIDQLIGYANEMLPYLYSESDAISLQNSLEQNLCFAVPGIEGASGICVDVACIHYYEMGLIDAAGFVIMQANK